MVVDSVEREVRDVVCTRLGEGATGPAGSPFATDSVEREVRDVERDLRAHRA